MRLTKHIVIHVPVAKRAVMLHIPKKGKGSYTRKQKHRRSY